MQGHLQILTESSMARKKKPELRVTPIISLFIQKHLTDFSVTTLTVKNAFTCDVVKAKLIMKEINRRRKQEGICKPLEKDGFVYLIENEAYPEWVKCGMTTDLKSRLDSYNQYDPLKRFKIVSSKEVADRRKAESWLIHEMKMKSDLVNGEWFRVNKDVAQTLFERIT